MDREALPTPAPRSTKTSLGRLVAGMELASLMLSPGSDASHHYCPSIVSQLGCLSVEAWLLSGSFLATQLGLGQENEANHEYSTPHF